MEDQMTLERAWKLLNEINDRTIRIEEKLENLNNTSEVSEELFLNVQQAAVLLGIKVSTLYCKVSKREIPYYKNGKILQFDKEELVSWITSGKRQTVSEMVASKPKFVERVGKRWRR